LLFNLLTVYRLGL